MKAVIRNGRWSTPDTNEPLNPIDLHQVHNQFNRIHEFTNGVCELTHDKIEILSHILHVSPEQEKLILKILVMEKEDIAILTKKY